MLGLSHAGVMLFQPHYTASSGRIGGVRECKGVERKKIEESGNGGKEKENG